jgi:molybdopterin adenylyltransferase
MEVIDVTLNLPPSGGKLVETLPFIPVSIAVLTVSDTRDHESDTSGTLLCDLITGCGHNLAARALVADDIGDVTPEALKPLFEKEIDGFGVVWHMVSFQSVGLSTLQSRACAGLANATFIFALPGSNGACRDGWEKVIRWQLDSRHKPCNMVELMPRLSET